MLTADKFVPSMANAGEAGMVAAVYLVTDLWLSYTVLSPALSVLQSGLASVFK